MIVPAILILVIIYMFYLFSKEDEKRNSIRDRRRRWASELHKFREHQMLREKLTRAQEDVAEVECDGEFYHVLECNGAELSSDEWEEAEQWRQDNQIGSTLEEEPTAVDDVMEEMGSAHEDDEKEKKD